MKAIKKTACIQNNRLIIHDLNSMNYKEVQVIIIPINNNNPKNDSENNYPFSRS